MIELWYSQCSATFCTAREHITLDQGQTLSIDRSNEIRYQS